jgi:hypothetical protein
MSKRRRGRTRGRSRKNEDEEEEKDPMPSIASLVTTPQLVGRVQCLVNIVKEVKALWTNNEDELPDDEIWPTSSMLSLYNSKQPCFELSRLAAISVKNTLCAVLLSKLEEKHTAEVKKIELAAAEAKAKAAVIENETTLEENVLTVGEDLKLKEDPDKVLGGDAVATALNTNKEEKKEKKEKKDPSEEDFTAELMADIEDCNVMARLVIIGFVFDRCSSTDDDVKLKSCEAMLKRRKMVRGFIQYCRDDVVTEISKFGQKIMWRLIAIPKGRKAISGYGGGEALITCFLAWLKRVRAAQKITDEHETDFNFHCNEVANREKEVDTCKEKNDAARKQAMRGLKQAKIDFQTTKATLEDAVMRLNDAKVHHGESKKRLDGVALIQNILEKHMLILLASLGLITVGPDYEMQSVMHRYGVVDCVVDMIHRCAVDTNKLGYAEMRTQALQTVGYFADRFPPIQNTLREEGLLSIILNELNRPQKPGDSRYTVLVSNVLYKCIDGNHESGETVCNLGILGGLCRMLHALYQEIIHGDDSEDEEDRNKEDDSSDDDEDDRNEDDAEGEKKKKKKKESPEEKASRLNQSEASLRVLAECSTSNEKRRAEILQENVLLPLLTLAATPEVPRIVVVSLKTLGNLIKGHKPSQDAVIVGDTDGVGDGLSVFCSILDGVRSDIREHIEKLELNKQENQPVETNNEQDRTLNENIAFEAQRCMRLVVENNQHGKDLAMKGSVLKLSCNTLKDRSSDATRRDACKVLSALLVGCEEDRELPKDTKETKETKSDIETTHVMAADETRKDVFDTEAPNVVCQDILFDSGVFPFLLKCIAVPNIPDIVEEEEDIEEEEDDDTAINEFTEDPEDDRPLENVEKEDESIPFYKKTMDVISSMRAAAANTIGRLVKNHTALKDYACRTLRTPVHLLALIDFAEPMRKSQHRLSKREKAAAPYICQLGARWVYPETTIPRVRIEAALALAWCIEGTELLGKQQALRSNALQKLIMLNGAITMSERVAASIALDRLCQNSSLAREDFRRLGGLLPLLAMLMGDPDEIPHAVRLITNIVINNAMNKSELARLGGVPALVRLLTHSISEATLQFALVSLTKHIIMHPEDATILMDTYDGRAVPKLVSLLISAETSLTLLLSCQIISLCSRHSTKIQLLLLELGTVELLVRMITPPLEIDDKTALFCLSAVTNVAGNVQCRKRLKKCGILRAMEALGAWEGKGRDFEHLRRAASATLAACTEPFFFDNGSAEFTQGLIVSDVIAGAWEPWPYDSKMAVNNGER